MIDCHEDGWIIFYYWDEINDNDSDDNIYHKFIYDNWKEYDEDDDDDGGGDAKDDEDEDDSNNNHDGRDDDYKDNNNDDDYNNAEDEDDDDDEDDYDRQHWWFLSKPFLHPFLLTNTAITTIVTRVAVDGLTMLMLLN